MRRVWMVAVLLVGLAGAAAWAVRPGRWAAQQLAAAVAQQMAAGDTVGLAREAAPALLPFMGDGHLAAAIAPLRGARVRDVRLVSFAGRTAEAVVRYADGRLAHVRMVSSGGGRWLVAALT